MTNTTLIPIGVTKVNPDLIPDSDFDVACSILDGSIRLLFKQPGIKDEYEKFCKEYEKGRKKVK